MADPESQRNKKVGQSAIDEIKKIGMSAALKKYTSGEGGTEFKTAMERYYSPERLKGASRATVASQGKSGGTASENKSVPMPASAPAAATRKMAPKGMAQALGAPSKEAGPKKAKSSAFGAAVKAGNSGGSNLGALFKPKLKASKLDSGPSRTKAAAEELSKKRAAGFR